MSDTPDIAPVAVPEYRNVKNDKLVYNWTKRGNDDCLTQFYVQRGVQESCINGVCTVKKAHLMMNYCNGNNGLYFPFTTSKNMTSEPENLVGETYKNVKYENDIILMRGGYSDSRRKILKYVSDLFPQ